MTILRVSIACLAVLAVFGFACGQTKTNTKTPSQRRAASYTTENGLEVRKTFNSAEQVCTISIVPRTAGEKCTESSAKMTDEQLNGVLNTLVPSVDRGKHVMDTFLNISCVELDGKNLRESQEICNGVSSRYEHVVITHIGNSNSYCSVGVWYVRRGCPPVPRY